MDIVPITNEKHDVVLFLVSQKDITSNRLAVPGVTRWTTAQSLVPAMLGEDKSEYKLLPPPTTAKTEFMLEIYWEQNSLQFRENLLHFQSDEEIV